MDGYFFRRGIDWYIESLTDREINKDDFFNKWRKTINTMSSAWSHRRPIVILVGGPSGMGKSSLSLELGYLLGIRTIICTDTIKNAIVAECPEKHHSLKLFSHECWKLLGNEYSSENLIGGFKLQCEALHNGIYSSILHARRHVQNTIIEGVHLIPSIVSDLQKLDGVSIIPIYIISSVSIFEEERIKQRYKSTYMHRAPEQYYERLPIFRTFITWWSQELLSYKIKPVENNSSPEYLVYSAFDLIERTLSSPE